MPGQFIVIYGTNNIGKSTQVAMLAEAIRNKGVPVQQLKYPIYDLEPTGPRLNNILRNGAEPTITALEMQQIYSQNRRDYEPTLKTTLSNGTWVIAEDYVGTGIAWGWTRGADLEALENVNANLLKEDLVILLDGERFANATESSHINETNNALMHTNKEKHLLLAERYHWNIVQTNQPIHNVHRDIWEQVTRAFPRLITG